MITDEMVRAALNVLAGKVGGCPGLTLDDVCDDTQCGCRDEMRAALEAVAPMIRAAALEEAAKVAEGPEYARDGRGEVNLRGTDAGNWSVPTSRFPRVRDYGQGRHDAATAIRALKETSNDPR